MFTKKMKSLASLALSLTMMVSMAACLNTPQNSSTQITATSTQAQTTVAVTEKTDSLSNIESEKTIIDREGKTLNLPEKSEKIISMAPSVTEVLIAMGKGDNLIAVDKYSLEVEGVNKELPTFDMMTPDSEQLIALKPDIIFGTGMSKARDDDPFKPVVDMGICMTYIPSASSIQAIIEDITFIGAVIGNKDKADILIKDMEKSIDDILTKIKDVKESKNVYFEIGSDPKLFTFGTGTFLNEIIELIGAKNIFADQEGWLSISEEAVIEKNPDIIFTNEDYMEDPVGAILGRQAWSSVNAMKNKTVYSIDKNASSRSNHRIVLAIEEMAKTIYPEVFKD